MTKQEACNKLGIVVYDTALPQKWVDEVQGLGLHPLGCFVWCYDNDTTFGMPRPLDQHAVMILRRYNSAFGTDYPSDMTVLPRA